MTALLRKSAENAEILQGLATNGPPFVRSVGKVKNGPLSSTQSQC